MSDITITLPNGKVWTPKFVESINEEKCIGCGRCFRVCGREVLELKGVTADGEYVEIDPDDDDDDGGEYEKKVMTIANDANCVGCEACSKICPKQCYTHGAMQGG